MFAPGVVYGSACVFLLAFNCHIEWGLAGVIAFARVGADGWVRPCFEQTLDDGDVAATPEVEVET